jgi:hypothetical protein
VESLALPSSPAHVVQYNGEWDRFHLVHDGAITTCVLGAQGHEISTHEYPVSSDPWKGSRRHPEAISPRGDYVVLRHWDGAQALYHDGREVAPLSPLVPYTFVPYFLSDGRQVLFEGVGRSVRRDSETEVAAYVFP